MGFSWKSCRPFTETVSGFWPCRFKPTMSSAQPPISQRTSVRMESTYSISSFAGLVSSMRMLQIPPNSRAIPKFRQIALACPMCR